MSLSREQREIIENTYLVSIFEQMEQDVIADIARRVDKTKRYTETAEILARNMRELGFSPAEIQKEVFKSIGADTQLQMEIAENTKQYKQDVAEIIKQTEKDALAAGDMLTAMAGDMSWNDDLQMWAEHGVDLQKDNALTQIVTGVQDMLEGDIRNLTQSTGFIDGDFENAYQKTLDKAFIKMATSTMGYEAAAKECIMELAKHGAVVQYGSGRKYHLDTATRMCVRTATAKLTGSIMEHNMQKTGQDLVYVDAHAGARPEHAVWQGKVFVYNVEAAKKYPHYANFWDETDYGSVTGLQGVNCMHNWYPYWPGDPIPDFKEPEPVEIGGKEYTYYEATQEQRKQERNIRSLKRERDAAQALGDKQKVAELNKTISAAMGKYGSFSQAANLRPKYERMQSTKWDGGGALQAIANTGGGAHNVSGAPSITKAFEGLRSALGDLHTDALSKALSECGNPDLIALYERHAGDFKIVSTSHKGTAYYSPSQGGIFINLNAVAKRDSTDEPYETVFHELAHNLDHLTKIVLGGSRYTSVNYRDADGKSAYERMREDVSALRDEAFDLLGSGKATAKQKDDMIVQMLNKETQDGHRNSCVSDTLESVIGKRLSHFNPDDGFTYTSGHGVSYWNDGEGKASQATLEMLAKYCEVCAVNPDAEKYMRRCFPSTMALFDEMIKVI